MKQPFFPSKLLIAILIIFTVGQISYPQNTITLGVKGGIISSRYIVSGDGFSYNSDFRTGLSIGITSRFLKSKHFMLMPEIYLLQRGMGYKWIDFHGVTRETKTTVHYLSFMFLPAYRYENKLITPYIFGGPRIEFVLNHNDGELIDFYYNLNNVNAGLTTGLGFEKKISNKININAEFRYSLDFSGYTTRGFDVSGQPIKFTNSSFDFLLGVNFALGSAKK